MKLPGVVAKLKSLLVDQPTPEQTYRRSLALCIFLLGIIFFSLHKTGLLAIHDTNLKPGEISLAGTWKIKFDDKPDYAQAHLDDADWCLINVPDSGLRAKPLSPHDHPAANCPKDPYPRDKMRNHTYWYRKEFVIPLGAHWKKPALFLGAIKDEGWVYWDGHFIGSTRIDDAPSILLLDQGWIAAGNHGLSIRSVSANSMNPGLFHAFPEGIAIGEFRSLAASIGYLMQSRLESFAVVLIQGLALLLLCMLIIRGRGVSESYFWIALYLSSSCIYSTVQFATDSLQTVIENPALIVMAIAISGYGTGVFISNRNKRNFVRRTLLFVGALSVGMELVATELGARSQAFLGNFDKVIGIYALLYLIVGFGSLKKRSPSKDVREFPVSRVERLTAITLLVLHGAILFEKFSMDFIPVYFHLPALSALLTVVLVVLAIEDYINKEKNLTFLGRFVRPGLRQLLIHNQTKSKDATEWFRGRQIPIIKVDIVGYTQTTFGMPYGAKRIFQDLWFKYVDEVLAGKAIYDKPEGDGSIYFLHDELFGGSCTAAMDAVLKIRDQVVPKFDDDFGGSVKRFLHETSEARGPMERYIEKYREKTGECFWDRKTKVRFALVYGYVDEGLWGMKSQSHYDLQGDLLILASRLEKFASDGEILVTKAFIKRWEEEGANVSDQHNLDWRQAELKGIGKYSFAVITNERNQIKQRLDFSAA